MTDIQYARLIMDKIEAVALALPTDDSAILTVQQATGSLIIVTDTIEDAWQSTQFGVVEVLTGDATSMRMVTVSIMGQQIKLATNNMPSVNIVPGDTIKLTSGPIKTADVYFGTPYSLASAKKDGKKFFITVDAISGELGFGKTLPGKHVNLQAMNINYQFELTCETPHTTGDPTPDQAYSAYVDLPTLLQQNSIILADMFSTSSYGALLNSSMAWAYVTWERSGIGTLRAAVLQFDISVV